MVSAWYQYFANNQWDQLSKHMVPIVHGSGTNGLGPIVRGTKSPNTAAAVDSGESTASSVK